MLLPKRLCHAICSNLPKFCSTLPKCYSVLRGGVGSRRGVGLDPRWLKRRCTFKCEQWLGVSAMPLFRLVDTVYESLRKGSTTRTLSHMHSHAFFPTLYLPNYISYISLYYVLNFLILHRRSLTDQLLAIQLRILFNSGTCKVSSPHLVSSD